ncbi:hypothetical protein Trydic_g13104 [Trypoxylus dichotomus]
METREDIPLKSSPKSSSFRRCNKYLFEGSRFITTAFIFLSVVITIALILQIYYGDFQVVPHGSVATDSRECSEIGTSILKRNGNAVDAAIAAAICLAVVNPHTAGLDATAGILIYNHKTRENPISFDFDSVDTNQTFPKLIANLAQVHEIYGHLSWKEILGPSVELARRGFLVSKQLAQAIKKAKVKKLFKEVEAGRLITLKNLANMLLDISELPPKDVYNLAKNYGVIKNQQSVKGTLKNYNIFYPKSQNIDYIYNLANISRHTYNEYNVWSQFHQGTISNIAVIDLNDLYVSFVIGMYSAFGSQQMTNNGYILDIKSSMPYSILPIIISDAKYICAKRIVLGVNDVCTATQIILNWVHSAEDTTTVIEYPRFVYLDNNTIGLEDDHDPKFSDTHIAELQKLATLNVVREPYSSCNFVEKVFDNLNSHSDSRGGGISSRF